MGRLIQLVDWLLLSLLHCTPPTLPPFLTHLTQRLLSFKEIKSFCSPRLKTSEKDEGNCWLSSECNLRFSCILCDAINSPSPSLVNVSSWLLFFCNFLKQRRRSGGENESKKWFEKHIRQQNVFFAFPGWSTTPLNFIVVSRGLCHQSCKKQTKKKRK